MLASLTGGPRRSEETAVGLRSAAVTFFTCGVTSISGQTSTFRHDVRIRPIHARRLCKCRSAFTCSINYFFAFISLALTCRLSGVVIQLSHPLHLCLLSLCVLKRRILSRSFFSSVHLLALLCSSDIYSSFSCVLFESNRLIH